VCVRARAQLSRAQERVVEITLDARGMHAAPAIREM